MFTWDAVQQMVSDHRRQLVGAAETARTLRQATTAPGTTLGTRAHRAGRAFRGPSAAPGLFARLLHS